MIRYFTRHPTAANLLMVLFLALGVLSLSQLTRETFPDFARSKVIVTIPYPGASALDVESGICARVEDAVDGVENVAEVVSVARDSVAQVTVEMAADGNFVVFLSDIQTAVDSIDDLPEEAERAVVERAGVFDPVISIAVTGPMTATDLRAYCETLRVRLLQDPLIAQAEVEGFGQRQIRVEARAHDLARVGMTVQDLAGAITRQSLDLPAGSIDTIDGETVVRFADERREPREFRDLIVRGAAAAELRLGDVATVSETFDPPEEKVEFDGRRAGMMRVRKLGRDDSLRVLAATRRIIDDERAAAPPGVELTLTEDVTSTVQDRLDMLFTNGWQGFLLVLIAMAVFFSIRMSFWVAMGLPVSFLGALFLMSQFGLTINMLSMVALLLALGLLMDDAIVIAENVATQLRLGKTAEEAAAIGVEQVRVGVLSSFLTTVCVLGPLAFVEGDIGKVLYVVPIVLVLVLAVSLVEAFFILPAHLAHSLHDHDASNPGWLPTHADRVLSWVRERLLGRVVDLAVRQRYATLGLAISALLCTAGLLAGGHVKFQAFPDIEGDVLQCRVLLPPGTPLARTEALVGDLRAALTRVDERHSPAQPGGESLIQHVSVTYGLNQAAGESGPHVATISADLLSTEVRATSLETVLSEWRTEAGQPTDLIDMAFTEPSGGPAGRAIEIWFQADDLEVADTAARATQAWFARFVGVEDLSTDLRPGKPETAVQLRHGTLELGLDGGGLASQLRAALSGVTATTLQVRGESVEVDVRLAAIDRDSRGDLADLPIELPSGDVTPLAAVASMTSARGYSRISRRDGRRTVTLTGDVDTRYANTAELFKLLRRDALPDLLAVHDGVRVDFGGETSEGAKTQESMARGMLIGLLGVFLLLSFQFRSYVEPLVVMIAIPMSLVGVVGGHWLLGMSVTMPSMLGFASLAGVVVNDSILLVEFIKSERGRGVPVADAARAASRLRFRAVLLTSVTTIVGLLPLLAERSTQAQVIIPLAVSIVFGMLASTVLVLVVVPALYSILGDLGIVSSVEGEAATTD